VFADPYFAKQQLQLPMAGLADNARGGRSSLKTTKFHALVAGEVEKRGAAYAPAELRPQWRWDEVRNTNRVVSPYEYGLTFPEEFTGFPRLDAMDDCLRGVVDACRPHLRRVSRITPLDDCLNSCGILKAVNPSTGAGMHVPGKKGDFIWEVSYGGETFRCAGQELREEVNSKFRDLLRGIVRPGVSHISLKDEVLKKKKIVDMATRMIYVVSLDEYVVGRMLFADVLTQLYPVLQKLFGMCFLINAHGRDWTWVYQRSVDVRDGSRVRLDADFKAYDLHQLLLYLFYAFATLLELCKLSMDVPDFMYQTIAAYCLSMMYRVTRIDGVWVLAFLGGPSGHLFTIYFNCMIQLFLWFVTWRDVRGGGSFLEFRAELSDHWNSLGDDCSLAIPVEVSKWFTCDKIVGAMLLRGGQIITGGGSKGDLAYGSDGEFLKRTFRFKDGHVVAPLNVLSCLKMLLFYTHKEGVDVREMQFDLLSVVWEEAFFHDDETRMFLRDLVLQCLISLYGSSSVKKFREDETLWAGFMNGTLSLWDRSQVAVAPATINNGGLGAVGADPDEGVTAQGRVEMEKVQENNRGWTPAFGLVSTVGRRVDARLPRREQDSRGRKSACGGDQRFAETMNMNTQLVHGGDGAAHAADVVANAGTVAITSMDNLQLGTSDQTSSFPLIRVVPDGRTRTPFHTGELAELDDEYLARPILIGTFNWTGSTVPASMVPHQLWLNNSMIQARLKGWTNVKFDLVVRAEYSPSFYAYGLARLWWFPLYQLCAAATTIEQRHGAKGSQNLGVWIDAAQPGTREIVIPWCSHYDAVDVTTSSIVADMMGELVFSPDLFAIRGSDGNALNPIPIQIRAYARNVVRAGPTRVDAIPQSTALVGPMGAMATVYRAVTGGIKLSTFTNNMSKTLSKLSDIAGLWGYSRDLATKMMRVVSRPARYSAVDEVDNSLSLALMNDYGVVGDEIGMGNVVEDEMSIGYIAGHDSVVATFFTDTVSAPGALLGSIGVDPMQAYTTSLNFLVPCSAGWVAALFRNWRGTLIYTFRVICSNQHSGSIRIVYDPSLGTPNAANPLEMARVCVLEVKPGAVQEIEVGWSRPETWLQNRSLFVDPTTAPDPLYSNGVLSAYVYNKFTAPDPHAIVAFMVSVRAGRDF
jgi:hypothetical protein